MQFTTEEEEFVVTKRAISAAQGKLKEGRGRGNKKGRRRPRRRLNGKAVAVWIPSACRVTTWKSRLLVVTASRGGRLVTLYPHFFRNKQGSRMLWTEGAEKVRPHQGGLCGFVPSGRQVPVKGKKRGGGKADRSPNPKKGLFNLVDCLIP